MTRIIDTLIMLIYGIIILSGLIVELVEYSVKSIIYGDQYTMSGKKRW